VYGCFIMIIIIYGNATVLSNVLGSTITFLMYREYIRKLLYLSFYNIFLNFFPKFREQNPLQGICC
jgi:hypothetical protein